MAWYDGCGLSFSFSGWEPFPLSQGGVVKFFIPWLFGHSTAIISSRHLALYTMTLGGAREGALVLKEF